MNEKAKKSFEERLETCPIHNLMDVDGYIIGAEIPEYLRRPLHELVIVRGSFGMRFTARQVIGMRDEFSNVFGKYELDQEEIEYLFIAYTTIVNAWFDKVVSLN